MKRKVLLIGWDAADWKVIMPLVDAGKMPHLAAFLENGICGNLATIQPVLSPMLWTSIATGKRAYKHGIHGFSEPDPVTGAIRPVTNLSRKTKAVWNILNQTGHKTVTIGWWPSNPAEELSRGVMVSNDYQRAPGADPANWPMRPGTVHPTRLEEALAGVRVHPAMLTEEQIRFFLPGLDSMTREELDRAQTEPRIQSLLKIVSDCSTIHSAALLMTHAPWDFMAVYYDAIDHFGHAFMRYHPPKLLHVNEWDFRLFNFCLEAGYRYHDTMLGSLLAQVGEGTTVILMSDHGFHPDHLRPSSIPHEPAGPAVEHRELGIFAAKGPGIRKDERIDGANLLDICPTLLHLFGLPVGEDMDGKVLLDLYEDEPKPIQRIPSWDAVAGDHGMHSPDRQISAADSKAALDQLVALGYIEEPDEDHAKALDETLRELNYNLARACLDGGLFNEAIGILKNLYATWPGEHRFGFNLATAYHRTGRILELRELVNTLIESRLAEATAALKKLESLNLDDEEVRKAEQERVEKMGRREKSKFRHEREKLVAAARPNLYSLFYLEAYTDFAEKNFQAALTKLEKLDDDFGARLNALILRGEIYQRLRDWPAAATAFEEALDIEPESSGALLGLARNAMAQRDFETAAVRVRQSIGLIFFQPRAHYIHGMALYRLGRWEESEYAFLICVTQAPLFSAAYRMLGEIARHFKRDAIAQAHYYAEAKSARRRHTELREQRTSSAPGEPVVERIAGSHDASPMPVLTGDTVRLEGIPENEIITVVSGLPRSGTSLMMQILDAAALPLFTDGAREADESNLKGYYEHQKVTSLRSSADRSWIAEAKGRAIKVVAPLLGGLPYRLPSKNEEGEEATPLRYRVIYMERELDEILKSQDQFLNRLGKPSPNAGADVSKAYIQQVRNAKSWCASPQVSALSVNYQTLVENPDEIIPVIAAFLGKPDKASAMRACVDPALYRSRSGN